MQNELTVIVTLFEIKGYMNNDFSMKIGLLQRERWIQLNAQLWDKSDMLRLRNYCWNILAGPAVPFLKGGGRSTSKEKSAKWGESKSEWTPGLGAPWSAEDLGCFV